MTTDASRLKRPQYPMPDFVSQALAARGLEQAYRDRPAYQQNDYIGWITRAKREETRDKRLAQMACLNAMAAQREPGGGQPDERAKSNLKQRPGQGQGQHSG